MTNGYGFAEVRSHFFDLLVEVTGRARSEISDDMKLSDLGFDDNAALVNLAHGINAKSWMHGAQIQAQEIVKCVTVKDVVNLIHTMGKRAGA